MLAFSLALISTILLLLPQPSLGKGVLRDIVVTDRIGILITVDGEVGPELEIGLFGEVVPEGVAYFKEVCQKELGGLTEYSLQV